MKLSLCYMNPLDNQSPHVAWVRAWEAWCCKTHLDSNQLGSTWIWAQVWVDMRKLGLKEPDTTSSSGKEFETHTQDNVAGADWTQLVLLRCMFNSWSLTIREHMCQNVPIIILFQRYTWGHHSRRQRKFTATLMSQPENEVGLCGSPSPYVIPWF